MNIVRKEQNAKIAEISSNVKKAENAKNTKMQNATKMKKSKGCK